MVFGGRRWLVQVVLAAFLFGACAAPSSDQDAAAGPPNVVLVYLDDADKATVEQMPNIRALIADEGMTFDRFYTSLSQCCPSRASLLTGEYVHNHGVMSNSAAENGGFETFRRRGHEGRTIAKTLRERDYLTGLFGKYLNEYGGPGTETHLPEYWSRWFGAIDTSFYDYRVNDDGFVRDFGSGREEYATSVFSDEILRWIRTVDRDGEPFFAFASFTAPHSPFVDPPAHRRSRVAEPPSFRSPNFDEADVGDKPAYVRSRSRLDAKARAGIRRRYEHRYRMLLGVDDFVKRLVSDLQEAGQLGNTYIFVASDNGFMQGEHRLPKEKGFPYEESVKVPLIVRGPDITAGTKNTELISMIDLFATFADLAGAEEPRDGRSIVPLFGGGDVPWRDRLLVEWTDGLTKTPGYGSLITERYKYVSYASGEEELYDLQDDPYEASSLHRSAPEIVSDLKAKLQPLRDCSGDECRAADGGP